eukprot:CAMPEP_0198116820 /NCGR_PEP_ID=MMETSP1442-20131203/14610_1 /TAXON_ID= /ORGANISM="Craspedostauros australis, Strain CCMP3328" /LENGTH=78 /DNA_ID=CAMNT_0043774731 /DNA_START=180 /DNA_END=416 /DNA_ORIENTATION=-
MATNPNAVDPDGEIMTGPLDEALLADRGENESCYVQCNIIVTSASPDGLPTSPTLTASGAKARSTIATPTVAPNVNPE